MAITGILVFLTVFCAAIVLVGGSVIWFFDIPSFILVFGFIFGSLLSGGRLADFYTGLKIWFSKDRNYKTDDLENGMEAFNVAYRASCGAGAAGFILGTVLTMINMPDLHVAGPCLAVACISLLLGLVLAFQVFLPARMALEKKMTAGRV